MSCGTNRCALRRFDGHGSSSYRPSNPEAAKAFNTGLEAMMAERARQDAGIFVPTPQPSAQPVPRMAIVPAPPTIQKSENQPKNEVYYSLSDSKPSSHS